MNIIKAAIKTAGLSVEETAEKLKTNEATVKAMVDNKGERAQLINRILAFAAENQPDYADGREYFCAVRILGLIGGLVNPIEDMTDLEIDRLTREISCVIKFRGNH